MKALIIASMFVAFAGSASAAGNADRGKQKADQVCAGIGVGVKDCLPQGASTGVKVVGHGQCGKQRPQFQRFR